MAVRSLTKYVKRYTTLSSALDTLKNQHLILLNPSKWDDTNDSTFMELYRQEKKFGSILALCCTMATETYHHWKVFTAGIEGVCIEIDRVALERALGSYKDIEVRQVEYLKVAELEQFTSADLHRLPFVKREGYGDEREWRIVACSGEKLKETMVVPLTHSIINRVVFNPWIPEALVNNLREMIRSLPGCQKLKIERSRLTNSVRWKEAGKKLCLNTIDS